VLTIVLALLGAVILGTLAQMFVGIGWAIFLAVLGFFGVSIALNLWVKKRLEAVFSEIQQTLTQQQQQLQRKVNRMQNSMAGKGMQKQLEKEQAAGIKEALAKLEAAQPLYKWNLLAQRQVNTLRGQLAYQVQDWPTADSSLATAMLMDPLTMAMKMTRLYQQGDMPAVEKLFRKGKKRFKTDKATLIFALYAWILVRNERIDDAIAVLNDGKQVTENAVLQQNWQHLVNGRHRQFSNAGLGDEWFALQLEKPKPVKVRQRGDHRRF